MTHRQRIPLRGHLDVPGLRLHESQNSDGTLRLTLEGELDIATGEPLRRCLRKLALVGTSATLDLSQITFIDCAGLRVILDAVQGAEEDGLTRRLEISPEFSPALQRLLHLIEASGLASRLHGVHGLACLR